jgi:hypothetical protein
MKMLARMIAVRARRVVLAIPTSLKNCKFYTTWACASSIACGIFLVGNVWRWMRLSV